MVGVLLRVPLCIQQHPSQEQLLSQGSQLQHSQSMIPGQQIIILNYQINISKYVDSTGHYDKAGNIQWTSAWVPYATVCIRGLPTATYSSQFINEL